MININISIFIKKNTIDQYHFRSDTRKSQTIFALIFFILPIKELKLLIGP